MRIVESGFLRGRLRDAERADPPKSREDRPRTNPITDPIIVPISVTDTTRPLLRVSTPRDYRLDVGNPGGSQETCNSPKLDTSLTQTERFA